MIRMLVADDHAIVRKGMRHLCESTADVVVAGEAASGEDVLRLLHAERFDLLLLDLTMPGISGAELLEKLHDLFPDLPILIFSMRNEPQVVKRMLKAGAGGYITKGCGDDVLLEGIRKVAAGYKFVDPLIAEYVMFNQAAADSSAPKGRLSQRELQILKLLGQGKGVNEIAEELVLNSRTVSTYKARLMQKMNFKNNAELILYASESGLI